MASAPSTTAVATDKCFADRPVAADAKLVRFQPEDASRIASWVDSARTLHHVAPNTPSPVTAAKVVAWSQLARHPFVLTTSIIDGPVAYGEINAMKHRVDYSWLGHIVTDPAHRGRGLGTTLVRLLLHHATHIESARNVSLIVFPDNAAAIRCYRRAGLRCMGAEFHQFGKSHHRHRMLRFELRTDSQVPGARRLAQTEPRP